VLENEFRLYYSRNQNTARIPLSDFVTAHFEQTKSYARQAYKEKSSELRIIEKHTEMYMHSAHGSNKGSDEIVMVKATRSGMQKVWIYMVEIGGFDGMYLMWFV